MYWHFSLNYHIDFKLQKIYIFDKFYSSFGLRIINIILILLHKVHLILLQALGNAFGSAMNLYIYCKLDLGHSSCFVGPSWSWS